MRLYLSRTHTPKQTKKNTQRCLKPGSLDTYPVRKTPHRFRRLHIGSRRLHIASGRLHTASGRLHTGSGRPYIGSGRLHTGSEDSTPALEDPT
ncbi:hypothetical protein ElyMa_003330100 [Elysia marginata]|uniref:Uncharacterized protein n=1 Tax=Elysia marginata TaxID=1093978 RepID=A0AAV4JH94_9GAST|nr:hypothetical protein ElyMa_003330100 [Elysia marginata]